jgi:hypothetical protein
VDESGLIRITFLKGAQICAKHDLQALKNTAKNSSCRETTCMSPETGSSALRGREDQGYVRSWNLANPTLKQDLITVNVWMHLNWDKPDGILLDLNPPVAHANLGVDRPKAIFHYRSCIHRHGFLLYYVIIYKTTPTNL